jgi:Fe-S cluster biosynthesis and repair protein YggX
VLILIGNVQSLSSLIILVAWEIWKHKNAMVFEGARLNIQNLLLTVANESSL